jgi:hypothetical protein
VSLREVSKERDVKCSRCGQEQTGTNKFCFKCGSGLGLTVAQPPIPEVQTASAVFASARGALYETADLGSKVIYTINPTQALTILERRGDFYKVKARLGFDCEMTGFVHATMLPPPAATGDMGRHQATALDTEVHRERDQGEGTTPSTATADGQREVSIESLRVYSTVSDWMLLGNVSVGSAQVSEWITPSGMLVVAGHRDGVVMHIKTVDSIDLSGQRRLS